MGAREKGGPPLLLSAAQTAGDHRARSSPRKELTRTAMTEPRAPPPPRSPLLSGPGAADGPAAGHAPPPLRQWAPPLPVANARDGRAGSRRGGAEAPGHAPRPAPRRWMGWGWMGTGTWG